MTTITAHIPSHGDYSASALAVDTMMARHLPASPSTLRKLVAEQTGGDWSQLTVGLSELLVVLASLYEAELRLAYAAAR